MKKSCYFSVSILQFVFLFRSMCGVAVLSFILLMFIISSKFILYNLHSNSFVNVIVHVYFVPR